MLDRHQIQKRLSDKSRPTAPFFEVPTILSGREDLIGFSAGHIAHDRIN
jgi:hypothetical protein